MKLGYPSWAEGSNSSTDSNLLVHGLCKLLLIYSFPAATVNFAQVRVPQVSSISDVCVNWHKYIEQQGRACRNEGHQIWEALGDQKPVLCEASLSLWKLVCLTYLDTLWRNVKKDQPSVSTALLYSGAGETSLGRAKSGWTSVSYLWFCRKHEPTEKCWCKNYYSWNKSRPMVYWNRLPKEVINAQSLSAFKRRLDNDFSNVL